MDKKAQIFKLVLAGIFAFSLTGCEQIKSIAGNIVGGGGQGVTFTIIAAVIVASLGGFVFAYFILSTYLHARLAGGEKGDESTAIPTGKSIFWLSYVIFFVVIVFAGVLLF